MTRLRLPAARRPSVPLLVAAAVAVIALVVAGLVALGRGGGDSGSGLLGFARSGTGASGERAAGNQQAAPVRLTMSPRHRATRVALDTQARVVASSGRLRAVRLTGTGGRQLTGKLADDGRTWTSSGALAPATRYRLVADAVDDAGTATRRVTTFTTLRPRAELRAAIMPLDGETVGVGLPIGVWFNEPVPDRAAVERRLQVTSSKPVTGAWHWFADNEVHYRPRTYWPSGSRVTLRARLAGTDAGRGLWGVADRTIRFQIGERRVSVVDVRTHRMKVTSGGRTLRVLPVSTGRERYPTTNGVHFVLEKNQVKVMDSSTVGIPRNGPGGYYQRVAWSVRISNSGEFIHAAPWSTGSQGSANVSHGCVNLSTANAAWFFRLTRRGDVVEVRGSPKRPGSSFGVADWNMSWTRWLAGSALAP
jgi:lipoprotein-anchoring transpeptidase ErfK/SrfK